MKAFLRHGEGVVDDDHRQALLQGLAQAARAGLADEEVGQPHVARDIVGEAQHHPRRRRRQRAQLAGERLVVAAHQDQLGVRQPPRDRPHRFRAVTTEQHEPHRARRVQAEPATFGVAIEALLGIELRPDDHAGGGVDTVLGVAERTRLRDRPRGAADEVLALAALDPEVRRHVRHVGEHRHIGHARQRDGEALVQRAVEVRHQGHDQIRLGPQPVGFELAHQARVRQPEEGLEQPQLLAERDRPPAREALVVEILRPHAGQAAIAPARIEHLEQVHQPYPPGPPLGADRRLERQGRGAMAATGVEINQIYRRHRFRVAWAARRHLPPRGDRMREHR